MHRTTVLPVVLMLPMALMLISCSSESSPLVRSVGVASEIGYARNTAHWMQEDVKISNRSDSATLTAMASSLETKADQLALAMSDAEADGLTADEVSMLEESAKKLKKQTDETNAFWKRDVH